MQTDKPEGVCLFRELPYTSPFDGVRRLGWERHKAPAQGDVMRRTGIFKMRDGFLSAFYAPISPHGFHQVIPVDEREKGDWANTAKRFASQFDLNVSYMVEIIERVSPDNLICRIWNRDHDSPPVLCIGETGWSLVTSKWNNVTRDKADGRRAFVTFDGVGFWEVLTVFPPLGPREPVRVEIARKRGLSLPGYEGVLEGKHLDFIADDAKRAEVEQAIQQVERDLISDRARMVILSCAQAADAVILEIGRQYVTTGRTFGKAKAEFTKTHKWLDASLNARTGAYFTEFEDSEFNGDLARFRAPLDSLRHWSNVSRHAGSGEKLLIEPDAFTAATCYGAFRHFIRVLIAIHEKNGKLFRPDSMPTSQAANS